MLIEWRCTVKGFHLKLNAAKRWPYWKYRAKMWRLGTLCISLEEATTFTISKLLGHTIIVLFNAHTKLWYSDVITHNEVGGHTGFKLLDRPFACDYLVLGNVNRFRLISIIFRTCAIWKKYLAGLMISVICQICTSRNVSKVVCHS